VSRRHCKDLGWKASFYMAGQNVSINDHEFMLRSCCFSFLKSIALMDIFEAADEIFHNAAPSLAFIITMCGSTVPFSHQISSRNASGS